MRASRLVSMLLLLQTRGRMTARELAGELEVSVRTIYRDAEALNAAGVPVYGDAGPAGGYQLLAGYRTRLTGLTAAEAESLVLAGVPQAAGDLGLGTVLAAAQLKLQAALPAELRQRSARIQERFLLDAPGWYADGDDSPFLAAVADAVWNQRRVEIRYHRWAAPTEVTRIVDPYGIVMKSGKWYFVGRSQEQLRTYRVSQVAALAALNESFDRTAGFDLAAYWAAQVTDFRTRLYQGEATIRLSAAGRDRLASLLSAPVIDAVNRTATGPDAAGWFTAVVPIESLQHAHGELLRLGAEVEVLAPAGLRDRLRATAAGLATLYQAGFPAPASRTNPSARFSSRPS
jgi:predicted DNA-binding transcriptional regulator YafY